MSYSFLVRYVCACMHVFVCMCVCVCVCVCVYMCVCECVCVCDLTRSLTAAGRALRSPERRGDGCRGEEGGRGHGLDERQDERPEQAARHPGPRRQGSGHHLQDTDQPHTHTHTHTHSVSQRHTDRHTD